MNNEATKCPNCKRVSVFEDLEAFQCAECGHWGFSVNKIIYEPGAEFRPSGQVYRKPRAA